MNRVQCTICGGTKGPLFRVEMDDKDKHYICKNCILILKVRQRDGGKKCLTGAKEN